MEKYDNDSVLSFDTLCTNNHIQIMKILLPFLDPHMQKSMAVMIKFMEFKFTMDYFRSNPAPFTKKTDFSLGDLARQVRQYSSPAEQKMLDQFIQFQNAMDMYGEMKQYMDIFQDMGGMSAMDGSDSPETADGSGGADSDAPKDAGQDSGFSPMDMIMGMLSPEQQDMFDMFRSGFGTEAASYSSENPDPPSQEQNDSDPL